MSNVLRRESDAVGIKFASFHDGKQRLRVAVPQPQIRQEGVARRRWAATQPPVVDRYPRVIEPLLLGSSQRHMRDNFLRSGGQLRTVDEQQNSLLGHLQL